MKDYVFISYSSKNTAWVDELTKHLRENGIEYWKAPENIPVGSNYAKEIPKAISECMAVVLLVSAESQNSIWVEKELDAAICARKVVIPVQLDQEPLNDMFRFYLNNVQLVPFLEQPRAAIGQVVERIQELHTVGNVRIKVSSNNETVAKEVKKAEKSNALRVNKIPVTCEECRCGLEQVSMGIYRCPQCGREYYDDFQKVRNFIDKHGAAPAVVIARATRLPLSTIDYFFQEGFLEIPKNDPVRMVCQKCGLPIRTGTICDNCKNGTTEILKKKDSWHSQIWKK